MIEKKKSFSSKVFSSSVDVVYNGKILPSVFPLLVCKNVKKKAKGSFKNDHY